MTAEAAASVDPATGAISAIDVTVPGSGYSSPPSVTITAPGAHQSPFVDAAASAVISDGALQSIGVDASGYGFSAPVVTIIGGTPTTPAPGRTTCRSASRGRVLSWRS